MSCANTPTPKRLGGGGGAPELQEAVNLPLSPWALKRGWALDGGTAEKAKAEAADVCDWEVLAGALVGLQPRPAR